MSQRLLVDPNKALGKMVCNLSDLITSAQHDASRLLGDVNRMTYGSPADYAAVEAELGLAAGTGADFVSLLTNMQTALAASIISEFAQRTDQG